MTDDAPAIELEAISKHFGDLRAVDNLSLSIPRGELFCFLGPNGAGKTTTIKMLTGLLRPTSGIASILGLDVQKYSLETKRIIGYVPDMPFLYERLTPEEFMWFTGDLYRVPRDRVEDFMSSSFESFGLIPYRNSLIKDLSHGFRQRLIYCATFLHDPKVLFIDEPLIGLDPYTIRMIKDLLRRKVADGMTILLTTHILALAQDVADRVGIITSGRLAALGRIDELAQMSGVDGTLEEIFLSLTRADPTTE